MTEALIEQRGFTLVEILIALALMALLSILSWQALDVTARSNEQLNASADDTLALVRVLGQIESDISRHADEGILPSAGSAANGVMLPAGIRWTDPVLTVVRSANNGAWQQVAWVKAGDTLRRAVGPAANVLPLPETGPGEVVLEQVQGFVVRAWIPGQGWSSLNSTETRIAATGLEVVIERRHGDIDEAYRKVVLLP
ncbi:prepilin-type N-terminal cleavage/methylation domain-containing protein [Alcaligenaceae bacterium]|nr:prepilin-type N-terminal cleavage/methylation domain-containing protein [Alcaligenaceae bacterium]